MGIWVSRAKPEESKFTYAPKTFITGLNYDFDLPGGKIALLYQQATQNLVCCLARGGAMFLHPPTHHVNTKIWIPHYIKENYSLS